MALGADGLDHAPAIFSRSRRLARRKLPPGRQAFATLSEARDDAERRQIERALKETGGHIIEAARMLGVSRTTLWEKMRRLGLATEDALGCQGFRTFAPAACSDFRTWRQSKSLKVATCDMLQCK